MTVSARLWTFSPLLNETPTATSIVLDAGLSVSSFGQDADVELYLVDLGGSVHRIVSALG